VRQSHQPSSNQDWWLRRDQSKRRNNGQSARGKDTTTRYDLAGTDGTFSVELVEEGDGYRAEVAGKTYHLKLKRGSDQNSIVAEVGDKPLSVTLVEANSRRVELILGGERLIFQRPEPTIGPPAPAAPATSIQKGLVVAPMPGKVIGTLAKKGETVKAGDPLVILESMKMEIAVRADRDGDVEEILVDEGASVRRGQGLVKLAD
jgi:3-methylcrotonyl-CoA carboxylase alpha subunit